MSMKNWGELAPYVNEAQKILREKFKFSADRAEEILSKALWAIAKLPEVEKLQNPRRVLLSTVRKLAAKDRREEKAWATRNRNQ
jgi:hypothetical protein